ncbi:hypothetical protein L3X38_032191 [Prunus dulcis]|uniref:Integrase catalytic domain-containing protein n=1 Tax=Prunus dulcis TaxID=3755 RepID=A0AAD4VF09_PRUDU|nr:hypothetical protein L3X38_032191 [Prunus dulcis]
MTQNSSRLFQLRRQSILTCQNGESVKVFYEKLHAIWQEIDCLHPHEYGCADDGALRLKELEADRVYDFLGGLDPPYNGVRSRILALSRIHPPLEAYAMVIEEDTRQSAMLGGGSMDLKVDPARQRPVTQYDSNGRSSSRKFSPSAGSHPTGSTPSSLDGPPKCRHCNGNHYSDKCFKEHCYPDWFVDYKARMYGPKAACTITQDETRPPALSANLCASNTMPGMGSNTWIIDTSAFDHMTYDDNMFDELSRNARDPYITSANGLPSPVTGKGTIHLTHSLPLSYALLVPNIRCNLLSVGLLLDTLNASAAFYSTHYFFQDLKTHKKIGHGKRIRGLYYLQLPVAAVRSSFDESSFKCETCVMAKSHRTVFPFSNNKAALPFELVHSDVWGPTRVTSHGFRWFVTFIDDCTRLTRVYLMKHKYDVASILPVFCAMVSTQFHASVKVFRTDNGGEYMNHTLTQFFRDQGGFWISRLCVMYYVPILLRFQSLSYLRRCLGVLPMFMSTPINGVNLTHVLSVVSSLGEKGSELTLAANHNWPILQFDVKNAFLHGDLKEEICMDPLPGIPVTSKKGKLTALIIYVDDMIVTGDDQAYRVSRNVWCEFETKSLGDLKYFLGIEVARSKHGIFLSQRKYVLDLLAETGMLDCKRIDTPSEQNHKFGLYPDQVPTDKERYQ